MSISKVIDIAKNSLFVYQKALSVASNNLANVDNENYSRQRVNFSAIPANGATDNYGIGNGVTISSIQRMKNQFTETQIRTYLQKQGYADKQNEVLSNIEALLSEMSGEGLSDKLNSFFDSWTDLTSDPTSTELRTNVVEAAQNFADKFQNIYEGLNSLRNDLVNEASDTITTLNKDVSDIRTLNQQIFNMTVSGGNANELLDQRDKIINELSGLANINVSYDKDNMASISIGGVYAVDRYTSNQFKAVDENGTLVIKTSDGQATLSLNNGSLGAIVETTNKTVPDFHKDMDTIANSLMEAVNSIHKQGYTNTTPKVTGVNFFESYETGKLSINKNILNDVNYIAASSNSTTGNSDIATKLSELADSKVMNGLTISEKYSNFVSNIANKVSQSDQYSESYSKVLEQLNEQKASYSGVSSDEETINILQYQKSYEAASKVITIANQLFDTLLNMVG